MLKILVIEDEDDIRHELMEWLQFEGYLTEGAANGRSGLEAALKNPPDLIICDIKMPEMNGHNVLLEVRSNPRLNAIPFIFVTASADRLSVRKGMDMGADDYLTKPFTHDEVINAVRSRLQKHEGQHQQGIAQLDMMQQALDEEREKRLLKSRLVAMFSHDFRNPLSVITSGATLLRDYEDRLDAASRQKKLNRIITAANQLNQMLEDMLFVAELESGFNVQRQVIGLAGLLHEIVEEYNETYQETHSILLEAEAPSELATDPKLIRHIMGNLITNAIKYSPVNTTVHIHLTQQENYLSVTIQDQGIGIDADDLPKLFQPFYRAPNAKKIAGTGLGLAIVKESLELLEGSIEVASQLEVGTAFTIHLPLN